MTLHSITSSSTHTSSSLGEGMRGIIDPTLDPISRSWSLASGWAVRNANIPANVISPFSEEVGKRIRNVNATIHR